MLCPYKKIIRNNYDFREVTNPLLKGTTEEFGRCDEFACPAYYEEIMFDDDNAEIQRCRFVEKVEKNG